MKFKVYRRRWIEQRDGFPIAEMVPIMTLNAKTPEAALRIAKQKGEVSPIVGPVAEEQR